MPVFFLYKIDVTELENFAFLNSITGALSGPETIFGNGKPFKSDEKCFLFNLKNSFRSQDI